MGRLCINLHEKDKDILYKIKSFFGVGAVYHRPDRKKSVYRVTNVNYIKDVIIPHFTNYPLISKKRVDFLLWSKVIQLILNKDHLTSPPAGGLTPWGKDPGEGTFPLRGKRRFFKDSFLLCFHKQRSIKKSFRILS